MLLHIIDCRVTMPFYHDYFLCCYYEKVVMLPHDDRYVTAKFLRDVNSKVVGGGESQWAGLTRVWPAGGGFDLPLTEVGGGIWALAQGRGGVE